MFTGIIEILGVVENIKQKNKNFYIQIKSSFTNKLKINQSIAHNGVCLTVIDINNDIYTVTAIEETLDKTNLKYWKKGDIINLERSIKIGEHLDGHIVQGHIDQVGICESIENFSGSWIFTFSYDSNLGNVTIKKGSIAVNGVSLTVVNSKQNVFSVAIIPYTYNHTNFKTFVVGTVVNLEFDIIGKYIARLKQF